MSEIRDRSVVKSSVIPSAKYCWSGSLLRLVKGSTTIDKRGATRGCEINPAEVIAGAGKGRVVDNHAFPGAAAAAVAILTTAARR